MPFSATNYEGTDRLSHLEEYMGQSVRDATVREARGILAESYPLAAAVNNSTLSASLAHCSTVGLRGGEIVRNVICLMVTAQAPGIMQGGIYTKTGVHLGHTASLGASIVGSTLWIAPLVTPVVVSTTDCYYVGIASQGSATIPAIGRSVSNAAIGLTVGTGIRAFAGTAAAADMTADLTLATAPGGNANWMAVS